MKNYNLADLYLQELQAEVPATRKCLERIPPEMYEYKPHEKSMNMGYLTLLVAEIPLWIAHIIEQGVVDFATFQHAKPGTTASLLQHFDDYVKAAEKALKNAADEDFEGMFYLKNNGQELYSERKKDSVSSTLNHWVHHRGQLTVYMRLNDILVPSIYGPSADEKSY